MTRTMMLEGLTRSRLTTGCSRRLKGGHLPSLRGLLKTGCQLAERSVAISALLRGLLQTGGQFTCHLFELCRILLLQ